MKISNCCGTGVYDETDVCMECKEHCKVIEESEGVFKKMDNIVKTFFGQADTFVAKLKDQDDDGCNIKEEQHFDESKYLDQVAHGAGYEVE